MTAIRANILAMRGYVPGEQLNDPEVIKLNTNENPYPPSPRVFEALHSALTGERLRKYPQPLGDDLRFAAARVLNLPPDGLLVGNGSDDLLTILTRAFVPEGGLIVAPTPSYLLYRTLAEIQGARFQLVPFTEDWQLPDPWPVPHAHLTFLPNPNSPSGTAISLKELERFIQQVNGPVVLDEAYADFCDWNGLDLVRRYPQVIVTRSFSKSYALAGLRIGLAVASPEVIQQLVKVKDSYNCDVLALTAAAAAIQDQPYFQHIRQCILQTRQRLAEALAPLGFEVTPSHANFLWCRRNDRPVQPLYLQLKSRKILVRYMNYDGYDGLRITVGTDAEIDRLLDTLKAIL